MYVRLEIVQWLIALMVAQVFKAARIRFFSCKIRTAAGDEAETLIEP